MSEKTKKGFKMPSSYTVLLIIIAIMAVLTWIIPAGAFIDGVYQKQAQNPQGIWDVLMAPIRAMLGTHPEEGSLIKETTAAIDVAFFILMVGGFLGVVNETGALDVGIASIVKKYKGREKMLIVVLMPLFALGGTTYGMGEETMAFYPLLVPVMMAVGFDSLTGVAIILLGSQIGCLASTLNPFATGIASATAGVSTGEGIALRLIFLFVMTALSTWFVYRYADKIQKDPTKSLVYSTREEDLKHFNVETSSSVESTLSKKQRIVLVLFILTFVLMVLSFIPWTGLGITIFKDINAWLTGLPVVGKIVGSSTSALGTWYFPEGAMLFAFMGILIGAVYRHYPQLGQTRTQRSVITSIYRLDLHFLPANVLPYPIIIWSGQCNYGNHGSFGRICQCQGKLDHHSLPVCFRCAEPGCSNFWYCYGGFGTWTYQYWYLVEIYR